MAKARSQRRIPGAGWTALPVLSIPLVLLCWGTPAQAQPVHAAMRALVVGSNHGGAGQEDLRFAEEDARRFAEALVEIGGYRPGEVTLLLAPDRARLLAALDEEMGRLSARSDAGESSVFTFYYSGHARAAALSLGNDEVPLGELRQRLLSLPSTVRVAILDACQTGAISQIKGAAPARDFSFNSVSDLNAAGAAIMASSSGSELSQESEELGGSFFTHHLLVGLRGAADSDGDGRVTLSEAYRYAYQRTLVSTARTAVGRQHVTLENDLRGKGEMVLSWPARASAQLQLPAALAGEVLVQRSRGGTVVAEISKAAGEPMQLALPPGGYEALVRQGSRARRCELALAGGQVTPLVVEACQIVAVERAVVKSDLAYRLPWGIELGLALLFSSRDGYSDRLEQFGFDQGGGELRLTTNGSLAVTRALGRYLTLGLRLQSLERDGVTREIASRSAPTTTQRFDWGSLGLDLFLRAGYPFADGRFTPYLQVGGGLALAFTHYRDDSGTPDDRDTTVGYELHVMGGIESMFAPHIGGFLQGGYLTAPALKNLIGDAHDVGGVNLLTGLRAAF